MFGLGTWEILLILVAALVFIGPDKLPKIAKSLGKGMRQIRSAMDGVDDEVGRARQQFRDAASAVDLNAAADLGDLDDREPGDDSPDGDEPASGPAGASGDPEVSDDEVAASPWERANAPVAGRVAAAPPSRRATREGPKAETGSAATAEGDTPQQDT